MFQGASRGNFPRLAGSVQSVRYARRRTPEYPAYKVKLAPLSHKKKDHTGFFKRHMKAWLGPKNIAGEYYENKYYYVPQNNVPNYIVPDGNTLVSSNESTFVRGDPSRNPTLHPFPQNTACKTASMVTDETKREIFIENVEKGVLAQELAHKYGLKLARVEAIVRLQKIERSWIEEVCFLFLLFIGICLRHCRATMMII